MALRLPAPPEPPGHGPTAGPGPVVVFLPAHDEEATVAAVVARVPRLLLGRLVECLVVDDGRFSRLVGRGTGGGFDGAAKCGWLAGTAAVRCDLTQPVSHDRSDGREATAT